MIIFKINSLICSAQGGEAGGGYAGSGSTGNYGGDGGGWGGYSAEAMNVAMTQSDAQATENATQSGWPGSGDTVAQAVANINAMDQVNVQSAIANNTDIAKNSLSELKASFLKGQLFSVAIGLNPISMIASIAKFSYNVNKIKSAIAGKFGDDIAEKAMADAISMGGSTPGVSPGGENEKKWQQMLTGYAETGGNLSPEQTRQAKAEIQREQDSSAVIQKLGPRPRGRDGGDWDQVFNSNMQMLEKGGRDLFDSAQGMGVTQEWSDYVQKRGDSVDQIFENPAANVIPGTTTKEVTKEATKGTDMAIAEKQGTATMKKSVQAILDADTNIEYNHTLADLSGIKMDKQEKKLLYAQKEIAIDRAITEIEDSFSMEGESMVAQQIQNLGENALGGTIGQGFVKRWQEREAAAKTGALQDIESTYLSAERQAIDTQKQRQVDIWGKEFEADKTQAELDLEKTKSGSLLDYQWGALKTSTEQSDLDRALKERMGNVEVGAWEESNKWTAAGGIAGAVAGSDWFGEAIGSIWS